MGNYTVKIDLGFEVLEIKVHAASQQAAEKGISRKIADHGFMSVVPNFTPQVIQEVCNG